MVTPFLSTPPIPALYHNSIRALVSRRPHFVNVAQPISSLLNAAPPHLHFLGLMRGSSSALEMHETVFASIMTALLLASRDARNGHMRKLLCKGKSLFFEPTAARYLSSITTHRFRYILEPSLVQVVQKEQVEPQRVSPRGDFVQTTSRPILITNARLVIEQLSS